MDAASDPELWQDFAVAVVGAAAALAGLLVVAVSINVREILADRHLPARAAGALVTLTTPLVLGVLVLVPAQSERVLGLELLVAGLLISAILPILNRPVGLGPERPLSIWLLGTGLPMALLVVPTLLAGLGLLLDGLGGLYWLPVAVLAAVIGGLAQAWVLLVEILR